MTVEVPIKKQWFEIKQIWTQLNRKRVCNDAVIVKGQKSINPAI
jgi:hypothetical protein